MHSYHSYHSCYQSHTHTCKLKSNNAWCDMPHLLRDSSPTAGKPGPTTSALYVCHALTTSKKKRNSSMRAEVSSSQVPPAPQYAWRTEALG